MANIGVASRLEVRTRHIISMSGMDHALNVEEAQRYLLADVQYIPVAVMINGKLD